MCIPLSVVCECTLLVMQSKGFKLKPGRHNLDSA